MCDCGLLKEIALVNLLDVVLRQFQAYELHKVYAAALLEPLFVEKLLTEGYSLKIKAGVERIPHQLSYLGNILQRTHR